MKRIFIYILLILVLLSCIQQNEVFQRNSITVNNQTIEIQTAFPLFIKYNNGQGTYQSMVFKHIQSEFSKDGEYQFILETIKNPLKKGRDLKEEIELLSDINFAPIFEEAFKLISKNLPGIHTKILIIPANPEYRSLFRELGIGINAVTVGSGKVIVSIDPTFPGWKEQLPYILAHEYHHSEWTHRHFYTIDFTPLEYLVFEGKADAFASTLFPSIRMPHVTQLSEAQEKHVWQLIKPELNKRKSKMNDLMMYGNDEIPYASGYTIGLNIVKEFKEKYPVLHDSIIIDIPAEELFLKSNYN